MTFDDVRRYLATRDVNDPLLGSTPLSAVRTGIQENEADFERLKGHLKARRAKEKAEEMRVLAGKQKAAVEEKNMQMAALTEFRLAKEAARMREVKAGLERERVLRSLKGVNEERLEELSVERTKELRVIENERQQLIERERELDVVVKKVEDDLSKQESRMRDRVEKMEKVRRETRREATLVRGDTHVRGDTRMSSVRQQAEQGHDATRPLFAPPPLCPRVCGGPSLTHVCVAGDGEGRQQGA